MDVLLKGLYWLALVLAVVFSIKAVFHLLILAGLLVHKVRRMVSRSRPTTKE